MNIALKEANETEYLLRLLKDSNCLSKNDFTSIHSDCNELICLLVAIVKTTKENIGKR